MNGEWVLKNSKPCKCCVELIKKAKLRKVYYSVNDENGVGVVVISATKIESDHMSAGRRKACVK
jgi:pyrimidine deaminase RibD-like protein